MLPEKIERKFGENREKIQETGIAPT